MADLTANQFADFFQAVHSTDGEQRPPFEWQRRLANDVLTSDRWPEVIRVPTGCGKTSVLDLATFELALQANREPQKRTAPRRVCFVIDRRLVVDEVTDHARQIQRALRAAASESGADPTLKAVAERLHSLAPAGAQPLRLVRLRGGVFRDDGWAGDPLTPTIIVSTVDQLGSRLLFRGYGVSRRNRPVHAGLLAFDTRIILDEAHLSTVFAETLDRVHEYQRLTQSSPVSEQRLLTIVRMSATAADRSNRFELTPEERKDERLKHRLEAEKQAELIAVNVEPITKDTRDKQPRKAREQERQNRERLGDELARAARSLAANEQDNTGRPRVIGVVVNRVATARQVFEQLSETSDGGRPNSLLLTGRIRPFDRDRLLEDWLPRIRAGREQDPEEALFVVATQTVEVGANLDFDALVTEAAPLDALRQRFGRLDRLGRRHEKAAASPGRVLIRSDQKSKSDDDPIYGSAIAETWKWLNKNEIASTSGRGSARRITVDFGSNHLDAKLPEDADAMQPMLAPTREAPLLFPAHLDAWVQTNPLPDPDPDVGPFLHGRADTPADVQVVWRADLDPAQHSRWPAIVTLMPPLTREALPVPIYEVQAWLRDEAGADVADVEGAEAVSTEKRGEGRQVMRWRGKDDAKVVGPDGVKPGDTIIVPASYGGADEFGWAPRSSGAVDDVAERCLTQLIASYPDDAFRPPKLRFRLHHSLLPSDDQDVRQLIDAAVVAARSEGHDAWPAVTRLLEVLRAFLSDDHLLRAAVEALLGQGGRVLLYPGDEGVVVTASVPISVEEPLPEDETEHQEPSGDEASFTGRRVPLAEHLQSVSEVAREHASGCALPDELIKTVELAGRWHDEGKRDRRFQAWLRGSEIEALAADEPVAKSGRDVSQWQPSTLFGYPRGARHELVSVRLFEQAGAAVGAKVDRELAKLLIGTHHGFGRAFAPVVKDQSPVEVKLKLDGKVLATPSDHGLHRLDSGWTDLFWRMVHRYGWWGLAYLEALLITADRTVSAREQRKSALDATGVAV